MSDPEFIRNTSPHEISMPIGARNALSKMALASEPAIHRVLTDDDTAPAAPPSPPENQTVIDTVLPALKKSTLATDETAYSVAMAEDEFAETPVALKTEHVIAVVADLKVKISDQLTARLVALKAENDEVSQQLDNLETLLTQQPGKK